MKKISNTDYASLVGLKVLAEDAINTLERMVRMAAKIVDEDLVDGYGHSSDFIYDGNTTIRDFLRRVEVEVEGEEEL